MEPRVFGEKHLPHSSFAEQLNNFVLSHKRSGRQPRVALCQQRGGQVTDQCFNGIRRLLVRRDKRFNFTTQRFVVGTFPSQERRSTMRFLSQRQVKQLIDLLPAFRVHWLLADKLSVCRMLHGYYRSAR